MIKQNDITFTELNHRRCCEKCTHLKEINWNKYSGSILTCDKKLNAGIEKSCPYFCRRHDVGPKLVINNSDTSMGQSKEINTSYEDK